MWLFGLLITECIDNEYLKYDVCYIFIENVGPIWWFLILILDSDKYEKTQLLRKLIFEATLINKSETSFNIFFANTSPWINVFNDELFLPLSQHTTNGTLIWMK